MSLGHGTYTPLSDYTITLTGAADGAGTLLTNSTALCKASLTTIDGHGTTGDVLNAASMTYSGTPGLFTYTVPAASLVGGAVLRELIQVYNAAGSVLHFSAETSLIPDW